MLAVFFDVKKGGNKSNDFIESLGISNIKPGKSAVASLIPAMDLLKKLNQAKLITYKGSLTTPPCSEIVRWLVVNDPQPISSA